MLKKIGLILISTVSLFALHTAELNLNDVDLEIGAKFDIGQFNESVEPNTMFFGGKFFTPDKKHSSSSITSLNPYFEANFLIIREFGASGMSLGFGGKFNYTQLNNEDFYSIPLGVEFGYVIPAPDLIPMSLHGSVYYAPQVLSFSKAKNYLEYRINYDIEVIKNVSVTLGYRNMNTEYTNSLGSLNYNDSWYFGFKVGF